MYHTSDHVVSTALYNFLITNRKVFSNLDTHHNPHIFILVEGKPVQTLRAQE